MSRYCLTAKADKIAPYIVNNGSGIKLMPLDDKRRTLALVFGFDHAMGHFFQIWQVPDNQVEVPLDQIEQECPLDEEEALLVDQSSKFDRVSHGHILEIFRELSNDEEKKQYHNILMLCSADLPY